jgi:large subunit ribosomal protein L19
MDIDALLGVKPRKDVPELRPGDTVRVSVRVVEGEKERSQVFQGVVIGVTGGGINSSFTVRRVAYGVGVERKFFFHSPHVEKVEVIKHSKVRRAKLFYLRGLSGKAGRLKEVRRLKELGLKPEVEPAEEAMAASLQAEGAQGEPAPVQAESSQTPPQTKEQ